jgi:hypothetical protein
MSKKISAPLTLLSHRLAFPASEIFPQYINESQPPMFSEVLSINFIKENIHVKKIYRAIVSRYILTLNSLQSTSSVSK